MKIYYELDNFTYLVVKANDLYFGFDLSKAEEYEITPPHCADWVGDCARATPDEGGRGEGGRGQESLQSEDVLHLPWRVRARQADTRHAVVAHFPLSASSRG
jgi:hypothetical protein